MVGQTPRELVWTRNKARLYHYLPQGPVRYREPLLFIYSLINKAFILDLRPGSSLLEFLVKQGYAVYLLDRSAPGPEDKAMLLDDYVLDYLPRAVKHTLRHAKAEELSLLGYCLGGVLTMCYAATYSDVPVKNLVTFTLPLDYSDPKLANGWFKRESLPLYQILEAYDNVPGEFLDMGLRLKDPVPGFITVYTGFYDKVLDERAVISWLSLQRWMSETIPFAGAAFKQWVEEMWLNNRLVKSELFLRNRRVDLAQIKMSYLNVIAEQDLIVPNSGSDATLVLNLKLLFVYKDLQTISN